MPAKARHRRWSPTLTRSGTALLALAVPLGVAFALPSPTPPRTAAVASDGTLLLDETFTGATAQTGFIATSDACLTGAAQVT
ncbi:MAG: hypothetical protein HOU01_01075, partial [Streptomycetaceae bacterium]|nr:hypothetical protein [Streptomycetaceae bacterium]